MSKAWEGCPMNVLRYPASKREEAHHGVQSTALRHHLPGIRSDRWIWVSDVHLISLYDSMVYSAIPKAFFILVPSAYRKSEPRPPAVLPAGVSLNPSPPAYPFFKPPYLSAHPIIGVKRKPMPQIERSMPYPSLCTPKHFNGLLGLYFGLKIFQSKIFVNTVDIYIFRNIL